jgi:DNA segregation ATPase FtsK/SpoIIIE, S-DNA-T family
MVVKMSKSSRSLTNSHKTKTRRDASVAASPKKRRRAPIPKPVEASEGTEQISLFTIIYENTVRLESFFYLSGMVISLYLSVCLFSYSGLDLVVSGAEITNVGGLLGAYASSALFTLFGYASWSTLCMAGVFGLKLAGRSLLGGTRFFAAVGLVWAICCICSLLLPEVLSSGFFAGGIIGSYSTITMIHLIGPAGAWLVVSAVVFGLGIFVAGEDLKVVSGQWLNKMEVIGPQVHTKGLSWGRNIIESLRERANSSKEMVADWFEGADYSEEMSYMDDSEFSYSEYDESEFEMSEEVSIWDTNANYHDLSAANIDSLPPSDLYDDGEEDWSGHGLDDSIFFDSPSELEPAFENTNSPDEHTKTKVRMQHLVEVREEATIHSDPDIESFHRSTPQPIPIEEVLLSPIQMSSSDTGPSKKQRHASPIQESRKVAPKKRRKKNSRRQLDQDLSLFAELQSSPDFEQSEFVEGEQSDPNCLSAWFNADDNETNFKQTKIDNVGNTDLESDDEHSDTQEQQLTSNESSILHTNESLSSRPVPHKQLEESSSALPSYQDLFDDEVEEADSSNSLRVQINTNTAPSKAMLANSAPQEQEAIENEAIKQIRASKPTLASSKSEDNKSPRFESAPVNVDPQSTSDRQIEVVPGLLTGGGTEVKENINPYKNFSLPSLRLLDKHERDEVAFNKENLQSLAKALEEKLKDFGVNGEVTAIRPGPVITTFEYSPARGVKISKIASLSDDIAMALKAIRVRIVAPIPGKGVVGIEIPNEERQIIWASEMLGSKAYQEAPGILPLIFGKTVEGHPYVSDLAKMPHLLVGGTTGSGKSVGINTMIMSLLFKNSPEDLKMILIDPKMLEFEMYREIPHLIYPVVTDPNEASGILKWACDEMDRRYGMMAKFGTRNLNAFNRRVVEELQNWSQKKAKKYKPDFLNSADYYKPKKLPYLVVIIDELSDLMMVADKDVEESIIRLAQKARACGIHLVVATQRPSVNVITGMIKANMPSRVAFQVRQKVDGRTILDQNGAENLLGKGDLLFLPPGVASLVRCHGPFITDEEVQRVTDYLRAQADPIYEAEVPEEPVDAFSDSHKETDTHFEAAVRFVIESQRASTSMIQRRYSIGYNRAANIIESMERYGIVGPPNGARPREILMSMDQYNQISTD